MIEGQGLYGGIQDRHPEKQYKITAKIPVAAIMIHWTQLIPGSPKGDFKTQ